MNAAAARALVVLALAGCGGAHSYPLPPAGSIDDQTGGADDGAGQLAQASVQLLLGDGLERQQEASRGRSTASFYFPSHHDGEAAFGGSVYGLDDSQGSGYGGFAVASPFGVLGDPDGPVIDSGAAAVQGQVSWKGARGVAWPAGCAGQLARAGAPATGAVVYLAQGPRRRDIPDEERWVASRGAVIADRCGLWPLAQAVGPLPAVIELENGGPSPLVLGRGAGTSELTLDPGARWSFGLTEAAVVRLDAGDRPPAWILGQSHDYHTVTDELGRFSLERVPAGTYELVVWYPPLVRAVDGERPIWTEPTTLHQRITVGVTGTVRVSVALEPAP